MGDLAANYFIPTFTNPAVQPALSGGVLTQAIGPPGIVGSGVVAFWSTLYSGPIAATESSGRQTVQVVTDATGTINVVSQPGRLNSILLSTASGGVIKIYDSNNTSGTGILIYYIPASAAAGTFYNMINVPFAYGITIQQATATTTMTIIYTTT